MKLLSLSILLSSLAVCACLYWINKEKPVIPDDENIFRITDSGNLIRYNKKTLDMTLCGLSNQRYRCLHFENSK